jgi:hypothetical protein
MTARRTILGTITVAACWLATGDVRGSDAPTVGLPQALDVWLPGPELFAAKVDDRRTPVVVRIDRTTTERDGFRYALVYTGYEPGKFDLRSSLRQANGTPPAAPVPPIPVEVVCLRPPGEIRLNGVTDGPAPRIGGYRVAAWTTAGLWLIGLVGLIAVRRRRAPIMVAPIEAPPVTIEERLRTLLTSAAAGTATPAEQAELERAVLVYWVRRLKLRDHDAATLYATLRGHAEARPMVTRLEMWLHAPAPETPADTQELLSVFRPLLTAPEKEGRA